MAPSNVWRKLFDVRKGEYARTLYMSLYLLLVMVAYYILKPVSAAMFLNKFNIDKLPYLYILIAGAGGVLAYLYTRIALKSSLTTAVSWTMLIAIVCLVALWWLVGLKNLPWMLYVFNIWVSLFSIVLFSQGWLVAANLFDSRQAKRLYGLLGLGAVVGAAVGSAVTTLTVRIVGTQNLILVCAVIVALAFGAFLGAIRQAGDSLSGARAADTEKQEFSPRDIFASIGRSRHLQLIIAITLLTFIVDELVDFQFQLFARRSFRGNDLTAFFATFFVYLNLISLVLQLFFTAWIVRHIGVGGTLRIMPASITAASIAAAAVPGLVSAVILRFSEAVNRYTFNRTGMELLFLPLPSGLKNRTKALVDIFIDRFGRGMAGVLLAALLAAGLRDPRLIAFITIGCTVTWIFFARAAQQEYTRTMRSRIERRRLELEDERLTVGDPATVRLLEQTLESANPRQVCYALSMLAEAPGYELAPVLMRLSTSPLAQVRATVYDVARSAEVPDLLSAALIEIANAAADVGTSSVAAKAVGYVVAVSPEAGHRAAEFLNHASPAVVEAVIAAMNDKPELAGQVVTLEWIRDAARDADARRRRMAAQAIAVRGPESANALARLLQDPDTNVVAAACRAAGTLAHRPSVEPMIKLLDDAALRSVVVESLAAFGARHCGLLGDCLADPSWPLATRCQIPRVLKLIQDQRSVDVLLQSLNEPEISIRVAVLRALSHLHETVPNLNYGATFVTDHILKEARHYFELFSAVEPFRDHKGSQTAAGLLERSLQERLDQTLERLFRLLGLKYPPEDMHAAYLAVRGRRREQFLAALDFLDTVLEPALKRVVMPLLDSSEGMAERGRDLFGLEVRDAESAIRDLIRSSDPWLSACAMAAAAERGFHRLRSDILAAAGRSGSEVAEVARSAAQALAAGASAD
ncbi:MAG TPA: Npt1/Npt2 family nucleotide transporter [Bryobacteraceae bacterium]|nr:Npt1/Npt2 family nucleotide transporter [Bryobacteraceae bacterium]